MNKINNYIPKKKKKAYFYFSLFTKKKKRRKKREGDALTDTIDFFSSSEITITAFVHSH